jgi:hypothetical protein
LGVLPASKSLWIARKFLKKVTPDKPVHKNITRVAGRKFSQNEKNEKNKIREKQNTRKTRKTNKKAKAAIH